MLGEFPSEGGLSASGSAGYDKNGCAYSGVSGDTLTDMRHSVDHTRQRCLTGEFNASEESEFSTLHRTIHREFT